MVPVPIEVGDAVSPIVQIGRCSRPQDELDGVDRRPAGGDDLFASMPRFVAWIGLAERGGRSHWETTLSAAEWEQEANTLGIGRKLRSLRPSAVDASGRWLEVELTGDLGRTHIAFEDLRKRFGYERVKSASIVHQWPADRE